jgi:hypothetical protein
MSEIKPTYATFEQAEWLKEIGFDEVTNTIFMTNHITEVIFENINRLKHSDGNNPFISRPEQWQVVEWLRVNYDICLWVKPYADSITYQPHWCYINNKAKENNNTFHLSGNASINGSDYNSPQEAYSAAFDYIKDNNLI